MIRMAGALQKVKQDLPHLLSAASIHRLAADLGHTWNHTLLTPAVTVSLMVLQVLACNTALSALPHLAHLVVSASAICQAKARLPRQLLQRLLDAFQQTLQTTAGPDFHGHRVLMADGSSCSMPDTPALQKRFGQPAGQAPGCGFPVAKFLLLLDSATGLIRQVILGPYRSHEAAAFPRLLAALEPNDLLVTDRGMGSFVHLALLLRKGVQGLFRLNGARQAGMTGMRRPHARRLGPGDQVVRWPRPIRCPAWLTPAALAALPAQLELRVLRYRIGRPGFRTRDVTLVTTLLDPQRYPRAELAALYGLRWQVEVNLRHLKTTLNMGVLKSRSAEGVEKELLAYFLVYNLVQAVMHEAARRQGVPAERISFIDAARWLLHARPGEALPALQVHPLRPGRFEPRVRKRRHNGYSAMTRPRAQLKEMSLTGKPLGCK